MRQANNTSAAKSWPAGIISEDILTIPLTGATLATLLAGLLSLHRLIATETAQERRSESSVSNECFAPVVSSCT